MPTFMQSLAANPNSSIYGYPNNTIAEDSQSLGLVNQLRDREMQDFKDKANFMADLSLKQDRLRRIYDLQDQQTDQSLKSQNPQNIQGMNTVMAPDPNQITGYQKGELGIRQQGVDVEKAKLAQSGRLGQEALDIRSAQEKLNQQKSDQINAQKQADMQRKIDESNQKLEFAYTRLQQVGDNAEARIAAQRDLAAAMEERHKAEMTLKQHQFDMLNEQHMRTIKDQEEALRLKGRTQTTTELNPDGTKKTVTTIRGNQPTRNNDGTYRVTGPDGKSYDIPGDKLDDWMSNHQPDSNNNNNEEE